MANDKKKNEKVIRNNPKLKNLKDRIDTINDRTASSIYSVDQDFINTNTDEFTELNSVIKNVNDKYKSVTGTNIIEFLTKSTLESEKEDGRKSSYNRIENLRSALENPSNGIINDLYVKEKSRFSLYDDYKQIYELIPQLAQAIDVYADNIMSPDDFTKDVFNIFYNSIDIDSSSLYDVTNDASNYNIINNIKELEKIYKIESKARKWIKNTLILGDQFIAVLPLDREFEKMLYSNEDMNFNIDSNILNESNFKIEDSELQSLNEFFPYIDEKTGLKKTNKDYNIKSDIYTILNNNVNITNVESLFSEELKIKKDFIASNKLNSNTDSFQSYDLNYSYEKKKEGRNINSIFDYNSGVLDNREKDNKNIITGSFVKELDVRRVVKIRIGEECLGYYYFDSVDGTYDFNLNTSFGNTAVFYLAHNTDIGGDVNNYFTDEKNKLLVDIFARGLAKKLNKKFIEDNKDFKRVIFELLKQGYIMKKRVNITYIPPDDVIHFLIDEDEEGYGTSKFKKILFSAKLYLATLTTTLMMKIARSADHRAFYIETGLSKDVEGLVQSYIRDVKTKEIKLSDLTSIDTIFNNIGQFHDYFIPQVNGEKALDIDTIPGQQTEMDNDLLDYLRKTMISGMGIPNSFLSYADEMEFARSVSMMNGMFLRTIISLQKQFAEKFSDLYRLLYKNEYDEIMNHDKNDEVLDYKLIEVKFPSPSSLNYTNMNEQISAVQGIVEFYSATLLGQNPEEGKKDLLVKEATKMLLPSFKWNEIEEIIQNNEIQDVEEKLKKANTNDTGEAGSDMSGDTGEDSGGFEF